MKEEVEILTGIARGVIFFAERLHKVVNHVPRDTWLIRWLNATINLIYVFCGEIQNVIHLLGD